MVGESAKVTKIEDSTDLRNKPWCINVSVQKVDRGDYSDTFVGLTSILPIRLEAIIDRDDARFEYDYDHFLVDDQVSIERLITSPTDEALEKNLDDLIKESQRILLLYGDEIRKSLEGSVLT